MKNYPLTDSNSNTNSANTNIFFMKKALALAELGRFSTKPNPSVGCILVKNDKIIGTGWHKKAGGAHAEVEAIKNALSANGFSATDKQKSLSASQVLQGSTAFVTLEPCSHYGKTPPCALALIEAGIKKVVIGMKDPNPKVAGKGIQILRDAGIEVEVGFLEKDLIDLNSDFLHKMTSGKPLVIAKVAMSLDGKTALENGKSKWITAIESRRKVQELRALSSCVLTGISTILADDSRLNVREDELFEHLKSNLGFSLADLDQVQIEQPYRGVLDSNFRLGLDAQVIGEDGKFILFVGKNYADANSDIFLQKKIQLEQRGSKVFIVPIGYNNRLDLSAVFEKLKTLDFNRILVEAGANLTGACLEQNILDELYIFQAPVIIGDKARSAFNMQKLENLEDKKLFRIEKTSRFGADLFIHLKKG